MTREELEAVRNHISNLPTVGAMYAPVLVEWVSVLLRQRDEVTAQRDNAVDASKEGAWMARALDAERERDVAQAATVNAALIHADLVRERDEARRDLGEILAVIHRDGGHYTGEHEALKTEPEGETFEPWEERRFDDLLLHARMRKSNSACVDYEVRALSVYDNGVGDSLKFDINEGDPTDDPDQVSPFIKGVIKWDGCSHNDFPSYYHGCQREHLTRLGPLFDRLFDWAEEKVGEQGYLSRCSLR